MRTLGYLAVAATVVVSALALPPAPVKAMECRELCFGFYPPQSLLSENNDERDLCQKRINSTGGFCTDHGRLNLSLDLPRGIGYRKQDYADPRYYYWDHYGFWPDPYDVPPNVRQSRR